MTQQLAHSLNIPCTFIDVGRACPPQRMRGIEVGVANSSEAGPFLDQLAVLAAGERAELVRRLQAGEHEVLGQLARFLEPGVERVAGGGRQGDAVRFAGLLLPNGQLGDDRTRGIGDVEHAQFEEVGGPQHGVDRGAEQGEVAPVTAGGEGVADEFDLVGGERRLGSDGAAFVPRRSSVPRLRRGRRGRGRRAQG